MHSFFTYIVAFVLFLFPSAIVHAGELDPQISAVQKAYRDANGISANFTQRTFVKVLDKTMTKKGKMYFKRGGKFRIEYKGSGEKRYMSNGKLMWVFVPGDEASLVTYKVNKESVPKEALKFLSGFDNLKKDFRISPSDAFSDLKGDEFALHMIPKSRKAHFKTLDAKFNARHLLEELKVLNKSGNISDYHFTKIKTSTALPTSLFTFGAGKATPGTLPH